MRGFAGLVPSFHRAWKNVRKASGKMKMERNV
jgi:hypothetical protein